KSIPTRLISVMVRSVLLKETLILAYEAVRMKRGGPFHQMNTPKPSADCRIMITPKPSAVVGNDVATIGTAVKLCS
ncbi:MAG: hypothetical protein OXC84_00760, partial [Gammaproteobacteria bacterium]|nr:hypothetical protein [Gammaproteobacteria bacterium]